MENEGEIKRVNKILVTEYGLGATPEESYGPTIKEIDVTEGDTTGSWGRGPRVEQDLGPRRGELQPERIAAFLAEFAALSKKYGILVEGEYDSPELLDMLPDETDGAYVLGYAPQVRWKVPEKAPTSA